MRLSAGRWIAGVLVSATAVIAAANWGQTGSRAGRAPVLLAHRGISQQFDRRGLTAQTCTAARMLAPTRPYLENTLASMQASFDAGADVVEIDVHPTTDGQFAVFHDWTLDCRTEGHGVTREHSMAELRRLDVGYGYTADGGRSFPFRGRGVGQMPSLADVLARFPYRSFLINIKSNDPDEGRRLALALGGLPAERRDRLMVYGGERPIEALRARLPDLRTLSRRSVQDCLVQYIAIGWSGRVPAACRRRLLFVPINIAPWLWGWPDRFLDRMDAVASRTFVLGPYHGGEVSTGIDTAADLRRLPRGYSGGIMTNEIASIAGALGRSPVRPAHSP